MTNCVKALYSAENKVELPTAEAPPESESLSCLRKLLRGVLSNDASVLLTVEPATGVVDIMRSLLEMTGNRGVGGWREILSTGGANACRFYNRCCSVELR